MSVTPGREKTAVRQLGSLDLFGVSSLEIIPEC